MTLEKVLEGKGVQLRLQESLQCLKTVHPSREFFVKDEAIYTRPNILVQTISQFDDFSGGLTLMSNGSFHMTSAARSECERIHSLLKGQS